MSVTQLVATLLAMLHMTLPMEVQHHITAKQVSCIAEAVYYEARGEPLEGQIAVAQVILNRVRLYSKLPCEILHQPGQFSFLTDRHRRVVDHDAWNRAIQISIVAEIGMLENPIGPATMFRSTPGWRSSEYTHIAKIGHHNFYTYHYKSKTRKIVHIRAIGR